MEDTIDNSRLVNKAKKRNRYLPWVMWILGALFFFYEFLLQIAPGVMQMELRESFGIGATAFGALGFFYFTAYATMQIPAGVLLDRFGPRFFLTIACAFCGFGTLIFASAQNFAMAEVSRFVTGLGSAFAMLGTLVLTANWFPITRFALLHGLLLTVGISGAVFGGAPLGIIIEHFHWRETMTILGIIGVALMLLIWLIVRDRPTSNIGESSKQHKRVDTRQVILGMAKIFTTPQSWLTALYGALMYAPTQMMAQWGPSFLPLNYAISKATAAGFISLMFFGWVLGSPIYGGLSDYLGRRKVPLYISTFGTLATAVPILYLHSLPLPVLGTLLFLFGFFTCGFVPSFSILREQHSAKFSGTALGFMNMINSMGAALAIPAIGIILDYRWNGLLNGTTRVYDLADYRAALSAIPVCFVLAIILLPMIKETHCRTQNH